MAKDLIYYYDKDTFIKHELGEIQTAFNQNFVIDGSKDSTKVIVFSFLAISHPSRIISASSVSAA